jgi:hypothetical protein
MLFENIDRGPLGDDGIFLVWTAELRSYKCKMKKRICNRTINEIGYLVKLVIQPRLLFNIYFIVRDDDQ